jgi:hypothetical protein
LEVASASSRKTATTKAIEGHIVTFQQSKITLASFFFFFFFLFLMAATLQRPPQTTTTTTEIHLDRKIFLFSGKNSDPAAMTTPWIFFFSPEGVLVSIKQEQKTVIEIYEGTTCVGNPTGAVLPTTRKLNYPIMETGFDTMLRFVGGENRWRMMRLYIIQANMT